VFARGKQQGEIKKRVLENEYVKKKNRGEGLGLPHSKEKGKMGEKLS